MSQAASIKIAIEELLVARDAKHIRFDERTTELFTGGLCEEDLLADDIATLLSGVKCMLQLWEHCSAQQLGAWQDLCFYMTGWMCAAVRRHGCEADLSRTIRNLQFSISKGSKAPSVHFLFMSCRVLVVSVSVLPLQNEALYFMLRQASELVSARCADIAPVAGSTGKSLALIVQSVAQYVSKSDTASGSSEQTRKQNFISFMFNQSVLGLVLLGVPEQMASQIYIYAFEVSLSFSAGLLGPMGSLVPIFTDSKSKRDRGPSESCRRAAVCVLHSLIAFTALNVRFKTHVRLFELVSEISIIPSISSCL